MATFASPEAHDVTLRPASESRPSVYIAPPGPDGSRQPLQKLLVYVHYAYPLVLLIFFLSAFTVQSIYTSRNRNTSEPPPNKPPHYGPGGKALPPRGPSTRSNTTPDQAVELPRGQRLVFQWVSVIACLTFAGSAINTISHAVIRRDEQWWCGQAMVIYIVGAFFVYALFLISLLDTTPAPTSAHLYTWILALVLEILLLVSWLLVISGRHSVRIIQGHNFRNTASGWEAVESALYLLRILILLSLILFYVLFIVRRDIRSKRALAKDAQHAEETTGLLAENGAPRPNGTLNGYGSVGGGPNGHAKGHGDGEPAGWSRPNTIPSRSWWEYIRGYTVLFPYLWPHKNRRLQLTVIACFGLVTAQRVINVFVPNQIGNITNALSGDRGPVSMPWGSICVLIVFRILQGSNGLLGAMRSMLWIPVSQYSYRELTIAAFEHVHSLSLDFHLGKKTGEVLSALGKGNSINNFLEQVTFQVAPMLVDLAVAIVYFLIAFDAYYALIVAIVTFWYMYLTIRMAQWRADIRRQMVNADRDQDAVKNDSMVSYETVKYFNAEEYEFRRYQNAVGTYQRAEFKVLSSLNLLNVTQNLVFMLGFMSVCFLMAYQVTAGQRQVGDFVKIVTYMGQLQSPLNFFGTFYRVIQSAMINSERMLELFKEEPTVVDDPDAQTMYSSDGDITFQDVHFNYDRRKPALDGLDFRCEPGTTTALVGESGGGKSTVFRLLFRFYNVGSGSIRVDDRDVQDVTIDSLRRQIGVVPQDTVLFNETLMYNLKYANPGASDEDVYRACRAASIHDKIMGFPDGYDTKVGERGLRLSGGEKQRVAIARTILKNPRIILLDEATAALDTETEEHIQEALTTLAQGRTMLVIAHRLSTITRADQILVLHEGKVVERGSHDDLLLKKGRYAMMWRKQVRAQRAAEEAKALNDKAARLRRESKTGHMPGDHGEDSQSPSEDESPKSRKGKEIPEQHRRKSSPLGKGEASEGK